MNCASCASLTFEQRFRPSKEEYERVLSLPYLATLACDEDYMQPVCACFPKRHDTPKAPERYHCAQWKQKEKEDA